MDQIVAEESSKHHESPFEAECKQHWLPEMDASYFWGVINMTIFGKVWEGGWFGGLEKGAAGATEREQDLVDSFTKLWQRL